MHNDTVNQKLRLIIPHWNQGAFVCKNFHLSNCKTVHFENLIAEYKAISLMTIGILYGCSFY